MTQGELKVLAIVVYLPIDLAMEIFRESGNLAISEFPATLKFAESIAEALDVEQSEDKKYAEPVFVGKSKETIPVSTRHKR